MLTHFNDIFLSQTKYILMGHFQPKFLENIEWTFRKKYIEVDNICFIKGFMYINKYNLIYASFCMYILINIVTISMKESEYVPFIKFITQLLL